MKIYLAGKMTGVAELNFPAFHAATCQLRLAGHEVVSPAELNPEPGKSWAECMRIDIAAMLGCDAVALLPCWSTSDGAQKEEKIARWVSIPIYRLDELLPVVAEAV